MGYKAHLAADDFGVTVTYVVTGACVHDCKVAFPLMKMTSQRTDFIYALMDKGYLNPDINAYAEAIERKVIIASAFSQKCFPPYLPASISTSILLT